MRRFYSFVSSARPAAVTIGNFDGFHRGHRRVVKELIEISKKEGLQSILITFTPHPRILLGHDIRLIQTDRQRLPILSDQPLDRLFFVEFSRVRNMRAEEFLGRILLGMLKMRILVFSGDFLFGADRRGDVSFLREQSKQSDFSLHQVEAEWESGERISSSRIRKKIMKGDLQGAARMLGRPYEIEGKVVHGKGKGREIGFPTLNIDTDNRLLPQGVFITRCKIGKEMIGSVTNIGVNPTLGGENAVSVETHLIDRNKNYYGRRARLLFFDKIRDERRFSSSEELRKRISADVAHAAGRMKTEFHS